MYFFQTEKREKIKTTELGNKLPMVIFKIMGRKDLQIRDCYLFIVKVL